MLIKLNTKDMLKLCKSSKRLRHICLENKEYILRKKYSNDYFNKLIGYAKTCQLDKLDDIPDEIWLKTDSEGKTLYYHAMHSHCKQLIRYLLKRKIVQTINE